MLCLNVNIIDKYLTTYWCKRWNKSWIGIGIVILMFILFFLTMSGFVSFNHRSCKSHLLLISNDSHLANTSHFIFVDSRSHDTLNQERNLQWCKTIKIALNVIRFIKLYITTKMELSYLPTHCNDAVYICLFCKCRLWWYMVFR